MLASVEKRRDKDARFFKPTALLAVIDGIADGSLFPSDIDLDRVVDRFEDYLTPILPARASSGWRPFWHVSRDGGWIFTRGGSVVGPEDFGAQRKPNSRRELTAKIDHVFVPPTTRSYWRDPAARAELRAALIAMLEADDRDSRLVAAHLRDSPYSVDPLDAGGDSFSEDQGGRPEEAGARVAGPPAAHGGQGFQVSLAARRAVERHAMDMARNTLEAEGWRVTDVSLSASFDFLAERDGGLAHVEVKGTTGTGERIIVTRNEVEFARAHRATMRLILVSEIALVMDAASAALVARGGVVRSISSWAPEPRQLSAISYFCSLALD